MKRAKIKNKILIALVLAVVMSGNAYSVMIDVRTDEEWRAGYIEGAIHIPLPEIKKNKPDVFITGHSHILKIYYDKKNKMLCINPGAAGNYGIHFVKTIVCFDVDKEKIKNLNIVELSRNKSSNSIS